MTDMTENNDQLKELEKEGEEALEKNSQETPQEESPETSEGERKVNKAEVTFEIFDFSKEVKLEDVDTTIAPGTAKEMIDEMNRLPRADDTQFYERNPRVREYIQASIDSWPTSTKNNINVETIRGERASDFRQVIETEAGPVAAMKPSFKDSNMKLTGRAALLRVRSLLGGSGQISIPLWHSGFWATFNSPDEGSILALQNKIANERISLGRSIQGAALANESVYMARHVLDFAIEHLVDTNLVSGKEGFEENLSALDLQHVAWGLACTMYQNGFNFARPIITDDPNNYPIQTGRINITKLQYTDRASLTDKQKRMMSIRNQRVSPEALEVYRNEFKRGQPREVKLDDNRKVTLKVPTLAQYLDAGQKWVDGIVDMVNESFGIGNDGSERNIYINRHAKSTQMRQYDCWVDKISVYDRFNNTWLEHERDDEDTIEEILGDWSSEDHIRERFFDEVRRYIDDSTISLIAVTTASEKEKELATPRFEELYPIDAVATFTKLLTRVVVAIENRSEF